MSVPTGGPRRTRVVAAAAVLAGLTLVVPPAASAGAATRAATPVPGPAPCARARTQWAGLAEANRRAKRAFVRAEALQAQLLRAGRAPLAHRLDARLRYLRQLHTFLVTRVDTIAGRIAGACSDRPPVLRGF